VTLLARARVGAESVRFIEADLFAWQSDRHYDAVFFGFWLSHVRLENGCDLGPWSAPPTPLTLALDRGCQQPRHPWFG
jgi:hypothetical protein